MLLSTVLLLLLSRAAAAVVPPPTNVTLSCLNLHVAVRWEYSEPRPQTRFIVQIGGPEGTIKETTDHQYDLTDYIWAPEMRYMDFNSVTVTAVEGDNQSEPVKSKTFSFNDLKEVYIKCELDFPPVDVDVDDKDKGATVSFVNPLHYYSELKHTAKTDATFTFTVTSGGGDVKGVCEAKQKNCMAHDILFPEGVEKKCVSLEGRLYDGNHVGNVRFRKTGDICATHSTELPAIVLAIMLFVLFAIISVIIFLIYKAKAWTMKLPSLPSALEDFEAANKHRDGKYDPVSCTDYSVLTVVPVEPCKNPSVSSEDRDSLAGDSLTEESCCGSGGELGEGYVGDLEEEEEKPSPYDCPHNLPRNLQVDMGDGDMVTGYSERERRS